MAREFTGKHALMVFGGAFTIIISVNVALAVNAVRTFPGLETKNSYVASQEFDAKRDAQTALGWTVRADAVDGEVVLKITDKVGRNVQVAQLDAVLGRATHIKDDVAPEFRFNGSAYVARAELEPGNWNIRMKATAIDGTPFEQRVVLHVQR